MKVLRFAVVCCLISTFFIFAPETKSVSPEILKRCANPPVKEAYKNAKAVFAGKILSVAEDGDVKTFTFNVEKNWKGASSRQIKVSVRETMRYQAWFQVGKRYLVYARSDENEEEKLWDGRCSRTKLLEDASNDIKELGKAKKPVENN